MLTGATAANLMRLREQALRIHLGICDQAVRRSRNTACTIHFDPTLRAGNSPQHLPCPSASGS
jgi:hypothetical protein